MMSTIHPAAAQGFSSGAALYQQTRPSYPLQIVSWLRSELELSSQSQVIDLAAGTGKFTQYLKQVTPHIVAVEPVAEMQQQFKAAYPDVTTLTAYSDQIPLESAQYDAVLAAQAFHWFANHETLAEVHRLLKPHGHFGLVWNQRDTSVPWVKAIADILLPLENDTPRYHSGEWKKAFQNQSWFKLGSEQHFIHLHHGTVEQVVSNRLLSTSFIAMMPAEQQQQLKQQFEQVIFDYLGKRPDDEIDFPYLTYAYDFIKI
ncbi:class I SAM-dependent methyltransferase [Acinetobacter sp. ANC 4636]